MTVEFNPNEILSFYKGKHVFVTGHTGFKGSWLCYLLKTAGAEVIGFSLEPPTSPNLFEIASIAEDMKDIHGDVRDYISLSEVLSNTQPEFVFHLAAQPIVLEGYKQPLVTYETNVMGTANILEAIRNTPSVRSVVNITTDKVYINNEQEKYSYKEDDPLDGYDPYSNSKSCSELVTHSYAKCFLLPNGVAVSTARAGNVIGGGDFAKNRIIPDCVRAVDSHETMFIRNPFSIRPYQHVLEPLFIYLEIARKQFENINYSGAYNVGPDSEDCVTTGQLVNLFSKYWGEDFLWETLSKNNNAPHEATYLKLDSSKIKSVLGWRPRWHIDKAVAAVVEWSKCYLEGGNVIEVMDRQTKEYCKQ